MALRWQWQNLDQNLNSQQTPHTSPSRVKYGVSVVRILGKIPRVTMAQHCNNFTSHNTIYLSHCGLNKMAKSLEKSELKTFSFEILQDPMIKTSYHFVNTCPGECFNIKIPYYQYRDCHDKDKMFSQPPNLYHGNPHTWKQTVLRPMSESTGLSAAFAKGREFPAFAKYPQCNSPHKRKCLLFLSHWRCTPRWRWRGIPCVYLNT